MIWFDEGKAHTSCKWPRRQNQRPLST